METITFAIRDADDPGGNEVLITECLQPPIHNHKDVLKDIVGIILAETLAQRNSINELRVAVDQVLPRALVLAEASAN